MTHVTRKWENLQKLYVMVSIEVDLVVLNFVTEKMIRIKPISFADLLWARPKAGSH